MDIYGKTHYLYSSETTISEIVVSEYNPDLKVLEHKIAAFLHVTGEFKRYKISYKGPFIDDM